MSNTMLPEHMDRSSRNKRLYETLKGMGLYVSPIFADAEHTMIDSLLVAADLPTCQNGAPAAEKPTSCGVVSPMKRSEIREAVTPALGLRCNVVDFPTVI